MLLAPNDGFVPYVPPAPSGGSGWLVVAIAYALGVLILGGYVAILLRRLRRKRQDGKPT